MLSPEKPADLKSIDKCRSITQEIINFGVNQNEILKIIEILSLELEDNKLMNEIFYAINFKKDDNKKEDLIF